MSQGKKRNKKTLIAELEPLLKLGLSIRRACDMAGIPQSTVQTWMAKDEGLRSKIMIWQNELNLEAVKNWNDAIRHGVETKYGPDKYTPSKDWLERKMKDEFSTRTENFNTDIPLSELTKEFDDPE